MKIRFILFFLLPILIISCATNQQYEPFDRGVINPNNVPEEELATLYIDQFLTVTKINKETMNWYLRPMSFGIRYQVTKIPQGINEIHVKFANGYFYTESSSLIPAVFESGKTYIIIGKPNLANTFVNYRIYLYEDNIIGDEVTIGKEKLNGPYLVASMEFSKNYLHKANENKIKLKSSEYDLELNTNNNYVLIEKEMNVKTEGKFKIITNNQNGMVQMYFYDNNDEVQMILLLLDCYKDKVLFSVEKPSPLAGKEILFKLSK